MRQPRPAATSSERRWHEASSAGSPRSPPRQTGPTVWMTWRAGRRPAVVAFASPVDAAAERPALGQDRRAAGAVDRAVHAAAAEQRLVGGVDDGVDDLLGDVAAHDLDGSGHSPVSIDFADAPTPILPRRSRFQPEDGRQGRDAAGRHGVHRPRGRRRAAREERRHAPERRRRADGSRVDGADARRARQRRRHDLVLPRHPLRRRGRTGLARLHHGAEGAGARPGRVRAPPADAARGRARHDQAHRARDADRERARRREPAGDRRRLRPHRDDHLRARRLRRRPRHPAAQRRRDRRRLSRATSGTTSSRAS